MNITRALSISGGDNFFFFETLLLNYILITLMVLYLKILIFVVPAVMLRWREVCLFCHLAVGFTRMVCKQELKHRSAHCTSSFPSGWRKTTLWVGVDFIIEYRCSAFTVDILTSLHESLCSLAVYLLCLHEGDNRRLRTLFHQMPRRDLFPFWLALNSFQLRTLIIWFVQGWTNQ